ncbi:reverse transcriptase domain-containing protein [Tanacetum coccineum]
MSQLEAYSFIKPQIKPINFSKKKYYSNSIGLKSKTPLRKTVAFVDEGSSNSDTDKIMARMDVMTMKMDAQHKELKSRTECNHYGAQYGKFLDMIRAARINVPLVDVLAGMPNYGKFLKELVSNKHKLEQISSAFLNDESSDIIQDKVPPKLGDPRSFLIPCTFSKTFSCNALVDLGPNINLMLYTLYAKLSLQTLKPTKVRVRLADRSFQYPIGIAENMLGQNW